MEAPITGVTVFTDGARVQRTGAADLEAGRQTVVISSLPAALDQASVRVTARGTDLALLNVETRNGYTAYPLREEAARLRAEVERCRDAVQALDDEDTAERARLDFLGHLSGAAATAVKTSRNHSAGMGCCSASCVSGCSCSPPRPARLSR